MGSVGDDSARYAWSNGHKDLEHEGELLHVKAPSLLGRTSIGLTRPVVEALWNESFLVYESANESLAREESMYRDLQKHGFPTLEIVPSEVDGTLVTKRVPDAQPALDKMKNSKSSELAVIGDTLHLMKRLHEQHKTPWGDAWLGNVLYDGKSPVLFDFGMKTNPSMQTEKRFAKDVMNFYLNTSQRTSMTVDELAGYVLDTYQPDGLVHHFLGEQTQYRVNDWFGEQLFLRPVYNMNRKEEAAAKDAFLKQL